MEQLQRVVVGYPSLREILDECEYSLADYRSALLALIRVVYGENHVLLSRTERSHRLTLYKLANLIGQFDLVPDMPIYELSYRCPVQLAAYCRSLKHALGQLQNGTIDDNTFTIIYDTETQLERIRSEVNLFCEGLS